MLLFTKKEPNISIIKNSPKELKLKYEIHAGIPFRWEYEIGDESIVKFARTEQVSNDNTDGRCGGRIVTNYVFEGVKEGETTITFKYVEFTEGKVHEEYVNKVIVDSEGNISLEDNF